MAESGRQAAPALFPIAGTVELMRPQQWVKNLLVFAALVFGKELFNLDSVVRALMAFVAMCMAASAVYVFNDLRDVVQDRLHPLKCRRPLASGRVGLNTARSVALVLSLGACALAFALTPAAAYTILFYLAINVVYSTTAKHVVILDVMVLAFGYVLRVLLGSQAVGVAPSYWLFLCTLNVSLFLALGKRRAELVALESDAQHHRRVLEHYSLSFLDQMIGIVTSATLVCYILYTVDSRTIETFDTGLLVLTVPFVLYGLFRYLYLLYHRQQGDAPTTTILLDRAFLANGVLWGLACVAVIYWHEAIERVLGFN